MRPARATFLVGFSDEGTSLPLVLSVIDAATKQLRVMVFAFTSKRIATALAAAKARGVDVLVGVDFKQNVTNDIYGASRAAIQILGAAGIEVRTVSRWPIMHDKVIVADGSTVSTGSFNFTEAASTHNSENVLVVQNSSTLAARYLAHWQSRWDAGLPYSAAKPSLLRRLAARFSPSNF